MIPLAISSQRVMPPKMLKRMACDVLVGGDHLERVDDRLRLRASPGVEEVGGLAARLGDDVERRHAQAGPVAQDAHVAAELHVGDALLLRHPLLGVLGGAVAQLGQLLVPVQGAVVDRHLRVERDHLAVGGDDQRVDLDQGRVLGERDLVQLLQQLRHLIGRVLVDPGVHGHLEPKLVGELLARLDVALDQGRRIRLRHLLHVHASHAREHREQLLLRAVEDDRGVVLGVDPRGPLDPDLVDGEAADVHADDRLRVLEHLVTIVGDLDPAGLAALADPHLRLDHARVADLLRRLHRSGHVVGVATVGNRNAVLGEELLSLVLEQVHGSRQPIPRMCGLA